MSEHIPSQTVYYLNYKITDQYHLVFVLHKSNTYMKNTIYRKILLNREAKQK